MAFPIPLSSTGRGPSSLPSWLTGRNVAGVLAAGVGSGLLALATGKTAVVIGIAGGVTLIVAFALLFVEPRVLLYIGMVVMWFDGAGSGQFRAGRIVSALIAILTLFRMVTSKWRPPSFQLRAWLPAGIFLFWCVLSAFWSQNMVSGWLFGMSQVYLGFAFFLLFLIYTESPEQLSIAFTAFVWIGIPIALLSDLAYFGLGARGYGLTGGANSYAIYIIEVVPVILILIRQAKSLWYQCALGLAMLIYLSALVASGSREGMIGTGLVGIYCFVFLPGLTRRGRVFSSVLGIAAIALGVVLAGIFNPERFSLLGFFGDAGAGRLDIWNVAVKTFTDHAFVGVGVGTFRTQVLDLLSKLSGGSLELARDPNFKDAGIIEAHNMYLTLLLDLGVVGLLLWIGMYVTMFKNLWDLMKTKWGEWAWAFLGIQLSLIVVANFGSTYNQKFQWMIFGVAGSIFYRHRTTAKASRARTHLGLPPMRPVPLKPSGAGSDAAPMDLRLRYPFRWVMLAALVTGGTLGLTLTTAFGTPTYVVTDDVLVLKLDQPEAHVGVEIPDGRIETVLALAKSDPYLIELQQEARSKRSVKELRSMTDVVRPGFSSIIRLSVTSDDQLEATRIGSVMVDSLDAVTDLARDGTLTVLSTNGRDPSPDTPQSYRGPLYEHVGNGGAVQANGPRVVWNTLLGMLVAMMIVVFGSLILHDRWRLSSNEDLEQIMEVPFLATLPRPRFGRVKDASPYLDHAAELLDSACAEGAGIIAITGVRTGALQSRLSLGIGAGLAMTGERPVIVIDLDVTGRALSRQLGLRRRRGFTDALEPGSDLASLLARVSPRRVPKSMRRIIRDTGDRLRVIPVGTRARGPIHDEALTDLITRLAVGHVLVLNLPRVPGPVPMQLLLTSVDAALLTVVDGWTATEDARLTIEALEAMVPRRVGFLLVEN